MGIFLWIVFGALAGWIASMLTGNNARMGLLANIIVGLIGAFIGGWVASLLGVGTMLVYDFRSLLIAIGGSVILLAIINLISRGSRRG
jgi:uncharacterized membrane protein YeaQ/YmgE (transglycosylase-associated protein family)